MEKTGNEPDEPEFDGDNLQLNVTLLSYGEKITHDSENMTKKSQRHERP